MCAQLVGMVFQAVVIIKSTDLLSHVPNFDHSLDYSWFYEDQTYDLRRSIGTQRMEGHAQNVCHSFHDFVASELVQATLVSRNPMDVEQPIALGGL